MLWLSPGQCDWFVRTDTDDLEPVIRELMPLSDLEKSLWSNDPRHRLCSPGSDAGEYDTHAGWITKALLSGGGLDDVVSCLQRGRRGMGLEAPTEADEPTARLIVERWRSRG
jgi:hypothetical protein